MHSKSGGIPIWIELPIASVMIESEDARSGSPQRL